MARAVSRRQLSRRLPLTLPRPDLPCTSSPFSPRVVLRGWLTLLLLAALPLVATAQTGYRTLGIQGAEPAGPAQRRVALVIGNAAYTHAPALRNSTNDATDIADALRQVGFQVVIGTDLSQEDMENSVNEFRALAQDAEAALFYYAGHGVQVAGENYLLPVDADIEHQTQVRHRSLALGQVMDVLDDTRARFKVVVLDACRDNPFASMRSLSGGLANLTSAPSGSFVAYATAPGRRASDNPTGRNGLFTSAMLLEMQAPGVELTTLFRNVRNRVALESGSAQEPWTSGSYSGDFFFRPVGSAAGTYVAEAATPAVAAAGPAQASRVAPAQVAEWAAEGAAAFHARSFAQALPALQRAADAGDAGSQTRLGLMHQNGWGVREDDAAAMRLYRPAAAAGDPVAQGNLGYLYQHGLGAPPSPGEAARLYRLAADQGRAAAQNNLGALYQAGEGVPQDDAQALRLYRQASERGLAEATYNLGFMTEHGRGTAADCAAALALYTAAGTAGHALAASRARELTCPASAGPAGAGR